MANSSFPTALAASVTIIAPAMVVATLGITLPEIRETLLLTEVQAGSLFSVIFIVAVVASNVAGGLSDRIGRKRVLLTGISSLSIGFALSGLSWSYALMLIVLGLVGLGYGFITPSLYALMSDLMPGRRGLATSLVSVFYGIGGLSGSVIASSVTAKAGWRASFLVIGGIGFLVMLLEMAVVKAPAGKTTAHRSVSWRDALSVNLMLLALAEFFGAGVFWSTASWAPTVLRSVKGLSLGETGIVMGAWGITPMVGALVLGTLSDRFGRKNVILWTAYPGALIALVVYYLLTSPAALGAGLVLIGILQGSAAPSLVIALTQDSAPPDAIGAASGMVMSLHYVSAVATPLIAAQLIVGTGNMLLAMALTSAVPFVLFGSLIAGVREKS